MSVVSSDLRNVAIVGHNGTGKTTLVEQMLFQAGAIQSCGTIENGKTVSDFTDEEIAKKISVHTALCSFAWNGKTLNILDTPGTAGFIGEAICGFRSCETALMLVDSVDGIQIETLKLWRHLDNRNKPRAVFINKMDKERADYKGIIEQLKERFKTTFVPVTIPVGSGNDFRGVINLIEDKAYFPNAEGKLVQSDVPAEYQDLFDEYHAQLVENAAEGADDLIEKFFDKGTLEADDIRRGLREGFANNRVIPVFCGEAKLGLGVDSLMNFIKNNFPSPLDKKEWILDEKEQHRDLAITDKGPFSGYCFKTTLDQFNGRLSFIKVVTGTLTGNTEMVVRPGGKKERPTKVYRMMGRKLVETDALPAGDIGIVAKADAIMTNCTLLEDASATFTFQPLQLPSPVYKLAISTEDKKSEVKMNEALYRVAEEDLTFKTGFDEETKESYVAGLGELHLSMILDKIQEKQKIAIHTKLPRVAYRETITKQSGLSEYTHKKQTGGHGQYAKSSWRSNRRNGAPSTFSPTPSREDRSARGTSLASRKDFMSKCRKDFSPAIRWSTSPLR
jgi:elongation factor G